jgi:hypothetical protein
MYVVGVFLITPNLGWSAQEGSFQLIPTDSPDWQVVRFGGYPAERLASVIEMQHEITCARDDSGTATCQAWINGRGDLRNAAPAAPGADRLRTEEGATGIIQLLTQNPDEPSLLPFSIRSQALVDFLVRPLGHDLYCRQDTCRFSVDDRGVIDPLPFPAVYPY